MGTIVAAMWLLDPQSFKVRQGEVGGYRAHFSPEQLARIEALPAAAGLSRFGYTIGEAGEKPVP